MGFFFGIEHSSWMAAVRVTKICENGSQLKRHWRMLCDSFGASSSVFELCPETECFFKDFGILQILGRCLRSVVACGAFS